MNTRQLQAKARHSTRGVRAGEGPHRCNTRWRAIAPYDSTIHARLRRVNDVGRRRRICTAGAIPGGAKLPDTICASFAATGRGWRHPTFTCRRPAPWKARWLKIQGGRASATAGLPAMAPTVKRGSRLPVLPAQTPDTGVFPGQAACSRGCQKTPVARVLKGNALGRATAPLKWLRSRHSRTRRTLLGSPCEGNGACHAPCAPPESQPESQPGHRSSADTRSG
jgi:hypothetical protein